MAYSIFTSGQLDSELLGIYGLGFSIRIDSISVLMTLMIALLGFGIIKFSKNYLDGDEHQGAFMGRLAATICSVQLLVISGNLAILFVAWLLTSISLHRLLVFYRHRKGAQVAAKKKFILARLADACLLIACGLLYQQFGTGHLAAIFEGSTKLSEAGSHLELPALFLILAAIFKSAQFPTHGWLLEVMETPTPVSALLHAGLLNAGPFLLIRMAHVLDLGSISPVILLLVGGFSAIFGSAAYLTQTSVKTALAYSSVAHMGFSLMVCSMGGYAAAMLHLMAHSFYKAHSFLSSGSAIDLIRSAKTKQVANSSSALTFVIGLVCSLLVYLLIAMLWDAELLGNLPLLVVGAVIVMGVSRIFAKALSTKRNAKLLLQAVFMSVLVSVSFFSLESAFSSMLRSSLPLTHTPSLGLMIAAGLMVFLFALAIGLQGLTHLVPNQKLAFELGIHLRNGFYANAIFDRIINTLGIYADAEKNSSVLTEQHRSPQHQRAIVQEKDALELV